MEESLNITSLFPPLLVLILGYLTKRIMLSLLAGIILASLIATELSIYNSLILSVNTIYSNFEFNKLFSINNFWNCWNSFICIFLLMLGIFVVLLQQSGAAYAYSMFMQNKIKNRQTAEKSSVILSMILSIDDYFSSLTVGSVMQPLTDKQKVPRAKLAFLVDSLAAPLAILCPFSSWVAAILGFLKENGINNLNNSSTLVSTTPFNAYFNILPFMMYSFVLAASIWYIVIKRISYGAMLKHETVALKTGNLFGGADINNFHNSNYSENSNANLKDFLIPIIFLVSFIFLGLLYSGSWQALFGARDFLSALQNSSAAIGLFIGGSCTLIFSILFFISRKKISAYQLPKIIIDGIKLMLPAILVLMLAWSLGDIMRDKLETGKFLAYLIANSSINTVLLPTIFFFIATVIAFALGSSWGTAAMLFPIAIPMIISMDQVQILYLTLGAVLSGCVAGDHLSPISDTTIMSATSSKCPHMDHVQTQLYYCLPIVIITGFSFVLSVYLIEYGIIISAIAPFILASLILCLIFNILNKKV